MIERSETDTQARIEALEAELARCRAMLAILFDENPNGIVIADAAGNARPNPAAQKITGDGVESKAQAEWTTEYGFFEVDRVTRIDPSETGLARAMRGETAGGELLFVRTPGKPAGIFVSADSRPLPGGGAIVVMTDVTEKRELSDALVHRNAELSAREVENRELIARLRVAVDELSTPVLEVWNDVLALPVVGLVDTMRSAAMTERLLAEVVRTRSRVVIVDLTGVELIDTSTADRFLKLARAVELLGSKCLITGIQPAVAQTLVELGVEFGALATHRNLKNALEASIRGSRVERS